MTTSPWLPSQSVPETCLGVFGERMSRMLKPFQLPWMSGLPPEGLIGVDVGFPPPNPPSTAGSITCPLGRKLSVRASFSSPACGDGREGQHAYDANGESD
jgi:hypothetical protein